jgi:hypothetical protein
MKRIFFLLLISIGSLNAMKEQTGWENLPHELQSHILSYVPRIGNFQDLIDLMRVDKRFESQVTDPAFLKVFVQQMTKQNPKILEQIVETAAQKRTTHPLAMAFARLLIADQPEVANQLLIRALITQNNGLLDLLLNVGIDPNSRDLQKRIWGWTALDWAIMSNYPYGAKQLLSKGADVELADKFAKTPLAHAVETGNKDMVQLLLNHGADASTDRDILLRIAQTYRFADIVKLLEEAAAGTTSHT